MKTIPKKTNKPNREISMMEFVARMASDVCRGQSMSAAQSILSLPKNHAVVVTAYVIDQVKDSPYYSNFLRVLETFFDR